MSTWLLKRERMALLFNMFRERKDKCEIGNKTHYRFWQAGTFDSYKIIFFLGMIKIIIIISRGFCRRWFLYIPPSLRFMCVFYFVVSLDYSRPLWCRQTKTKNTRFLFSDSPSWRITCVCFFLIFFFTCSFIFYFYKYAGSVPSFFFDTIIFSSYSEPLGQYEILVLPIDFVRFSCKSSLAPKIFIFFFFYIFALGKSFK